MANSTGMLSMIAAPALISRAASALWLPQPTGSIQYPKPIMMAAAGSVATGTISARPMRCIYPSTFTIAPHSLI